MCIAYNDNYGFPRNKYEIYNDAVDALLRKWDSSRRIRRDEIYKYFSKHRKESMFSEIAYKTFLRNEYFLPQRTLEQYIEKYIKNLPYDRGERIDIDSRTVLKAIEIQHGIFIERAKNIYSFSHLTLQEFFTAKYYIENQNDNTICEFVEKFIQDDRWREVILLFFGMIHRADDIFLQIINKINSHFNDQNIKLILNAAAKRAEESNKNYPLMFLRALELTNSVLGITLHRLIKIKEHVEEFRNEISIRLTKMRDYGVEYVLEFIHEYDIKDNISQQLRPFNLVEMLEALSHELSCARDLNINIAKLNASREKELNKYGKLANCLNKIIGQYRYMLTIVDSLPNFYGETESDSEYFNRHCFEDSTTHCDIRDESIDQYLTVINEELLPALDETLSNVSIAVEYIEKIDLEIIEIDEDFHDVFYLYIKANKLIIDCLNTDCYVSNSVRKSVLNQLFIPS